MKSVRYIFWKAGDVWLGYLEDFSDYMTQGETPEDLMENLKDIYMDISSDLVPGVRRMAELTIP